jgi:predicted nucleic acid-binding Zn ribbon protein
MQRITDDPVTKCEICGAPVQRVFHPVAVHFKGKGFYNTDYGTRRRQRETAAAAEGKKADGGSGTDHSSNGAKPKEAKPDKASGATKSAGD